MSAAVSMVRPDGRTALRVITQSEIRSFRACARAHRYRYVMRRRPVTVRESLAFGTLWHVGMEAWWSPDNVVSPGRWHDTRAEQALKAMRAHGADPFALVMAEELLIAYTARWGEAQYEPLAVETSFHVPLRNPATGAASRTVRLGGKLDAIAFDDRGRCVIVEHKTASGDIEPGSMYWRRITTLDVQVSMYMAGAHAAGWDVEACIYDVVRKPALRPLKATPIESRKYTQAGRLYANQREHDETPEEYRLRLREDISERVDRYFVRAEIVRLDQDEREHAYDVWQTAELMRRSEARGLAPRNPDACSSFGGCDYFAVCCGEASIDDETLFRTAEAAHEELEGA